MKKLLILVFTLFSILALNGCKADKKPGTHLTGTRYVYKYSYEDYKELCDFSIDKYDADGRDFSKPIPDYQFEGVVKKVYEIVTTNSCIKEGHPIDNTTTCPTCIYDGRVTLYCYTDENNAFKLAFYEPMDLNFYVAENGLQKFEEVDGSPYYMANIFSRNHSLRYVFHVDLTTEAKTYHVENASLGTYTANYTEEEIKYWYDLTFNTMKEDHKAIEDKN